MGRQLFRSQQNKMIGGVCSGIAEYLSMDPNIMRLIWLIIGFMGPGVIAYLIAWVIIPKQPDDFFSNPRAFSGTGEDPRDFESKDVHRTFNSENSKFIFGAALIILGMVFLFKQFFSWFDMKYFLPLMLIIIGGLIIFKGRRDSF